MTRCAKINLENGHVEGVIMADAENDPHPDGFLLVQLADDQDVNPDWMYVDGVFVAPPAPEPVVVVPQSITRRQCAMMMFSMQMISGSDAIAMTQTGTPPAAVQAYLDTLPEPQRTMAIMDFAATDYYRENPLLLALMQANNMTEDQVDTFFIEAAKL